MWKPGRRRWSATPSTFQNAVAASTDPPSSAGTARKPIVVVRTADGSPPSPATSERRTASSLGTPVTPTLRRAGGRGGGVGGWGVNEARGGGAQALAAARAAPRGAARGTAGVAGTAEATLSA